MMEEQHLMRVTASDPSGQLFTGGYLMATRPVLYDYVPQPDITVYELALMIPVIIFATTTEDDVMALPESARRHFVKQG